MTDENKIKTVQTILNIPAKVLITTNCGKKYILAKKDTGGVEMVGEEINSFNAERLHPDALEKLKL